MLKCLHCILNQYGRRTLVSKYSNKKTAEHVSPAPKGFSSKSVGSEDKFWDDPIRAWKMSPVASGSDDEMDEGDDSESRSVKVALRLGIVYRVTCYKSII